MYKQMLIYHILLLHLHHDGGDDDAHGHGHALRDRAHSHLHGDENVLLLIYDDPHYCHLFLILVPILQMMDLITNGTTQWVGAGYHINTDPDALVRDILDGIEAKRAALGI